MEENQKPAPKKRGRKPKPGNLKENYFGEREESAIKTYLFGELSFADKNELFKKIINPCCEKLVDGVMSMPQFQKILGISREKLREDAYYHLIFQMDKFDPNQIGKSGQPVKAFSYFGTVVKNYVLGIKIANDAKVADFGGTLDVDTLEDHIPDLRRKSGDFEEVREELLVMLEKAIEAKRLNKNDLIVGNTLKYMVTHWHKLEFQKKNEFVRLLCHYTQLSPSVVARSLKKYKILVHGVVETLPKEKGRKKVELQTIESSFTQAFNMTNLEEAKKIVVRAIKKTNLKELEKQSIFLEIKLKYNLHEFHSYIADCLLELEGISLK